MLHCRAGPPERREVAEADAPADAFATPVEGRRRVVEFPHHDRAAPRRSSDLPTRLRAEEINESCHRRQVAVVDEESATYPESGRQVPPVEDRIREAMCSVDEDEVERA